MNRDLINKYIALPMAITVFRQDQKSFKSFSMSNLYLDKLDAVIETMKEDFYALKKDMITKYHLNIRCIDQCKYSVNGNVIEYAPEELRSLTSHLMRDYLYGGKATRFERKERVWDE